MSVTRRELLGVGVTALVSARAVFAATESVRTPSAYGAIFAPLDAFVERYMRDMHAPGMTLALADGDGVHRVVTYGLSDIERNVKVRADELFEIGSISKSFIALCLLQLRDEGKIDFNKPVVTYLPWFKIDSKFAPVTTHHLLTHSSGLHAMAPVFLTDPGRGHRAAYAPGQHFFYNNMGFALLGHLACTLDGRELPALLRERVFKPLGMNNSEPVIDFDMRQRLAKSYEFFKTDRPAPRAGRLAEADGMVMTDASGSIAAPAADMGAYLRMLCRHGESAKGRLLSEEAFKNFSQPHIEAKEFGPIASYAYGIAQEQVEGENYLMHTGGMVSFASALRVNLDTGVGAFASINAMQGYRPTPVVKFALQLMRAQRKHISLPSAPELDSEWTEAKAAQYVGTYGEPSGKHLIVAQQGKQLHLEQPGGRIALEPALEPDHFVVMDRLYERYPLVFTRNNPDDPNSGVVEAAWGTDWYPGKAYSGEQKFAIPPAWKAYEGHYRNDSAWIGSIRVLARKGKLWVNGTMPMEQQGDVFLLRDDEYSTEWIQFLDVVNGRCMRIKFSGEDLRRVMAP
jgi:CubicO group peptidase (beta-lactamase class C family)